MGRAGLLQPQKLDRCAAGHRAAAQYDDRQRCVARGRRTGQKWQRNIEALGDGDNCCIVANAVPNGTVSSMYSFTQEKQHALAADGHTGEMQLARC